jgi:hypothetical protein
MRTKPLPAEKSSGIPFVGLPIFGGCILVILLVAERAGLPSSLFTQLFIFSLTVLVIIVAMSTRTLDGRQFFRPESAGSRSTRALAATVLLGCGAPIVLALPAWQENPTQYLAFYVSLISGGLLYLLILAPALTRSDAPDLVRLAIPDQAHSFFRLTGYGLALIVLIAALGGLTLLVTGFAKSQSLMPESFVTRGCVGLAGLVAVLGGRAGIIRLAALSMPIVVGATIAISIVVAGLEVTDLGGLLTALGETSAANPAASANELWPGSANAAGLIGAMIISVAILGISMGNFGDRPKLPFAAGSQPVPLTFGISAALVLASVAGFAAISSEAGISEAFAFHALPASLELPVVFVAAGSAAIMTSLCALISALLFALSSVVLRGIVPIFIERRQPDSRQLFRARFLIIASAIILLAYSERLDAVWLATAILLGLCLLSAYCLPALMSQSTHSARLGDRTKRLNRALAVQWPVSTAIFAIGIYLAEPSPMITDLSLNGLLQNPAIQSLPAALGMGIVICWFLLRSGSTPATAKR